MRKKIFLVLIFLLFVVPLNSYSAVNGDVNGDGNVNSIDYILIRKHILNQAILTGDKLKVADINADGKIN